MFDLIAESENQYQCKRTGVIIVYRPMTTYFRSWIELKWAGAASELAPLQGMEDPIEIVKAASAAGIDVSRPARTEADIADVVLRFAIIRFENIANAPDLCDEEVKTNLGGYPATLKTAESIDPYLTGDLGADLMDFVDEYQTKKKDLDEEEKNESAGQ